MSITITRDIDCQEAESCDFQFRRVAGPLTISGMPGGQRPVIRRRQGYLGRFGITIDHLAGPVAISDLVLDDGPNRAYGPPGTVWTNAACPAATGCQSSPLDIEYSSHVRIQDLASINAKAMGLAIRAGTDITVVHSEFANSWLHGIWVADIPASRGLHIEHNRFEDIRSNAIMFSSAPPDAGSGKQWNTIQDNVFRHCHYAAVYHTCGPAGAAPCGGGELDINQRSESVLVEGNDISAGIADEDPTPSTRVPVSGIEVAPEHVSNVLMIRNRIHDLTGWGIAIDTPSGTLAGLRAVKNCFDHVRQPAILNARYLDENSGNGAACVPCTLSQAPPR